MIPQPESESGALFLRSDEPKQITWNVGGEPLLAIARDGFYVRGVKLEQDESGARAVFEAFRDWLRGMRMAV